MTVLLIQGISGYLINYNHTFYLFTLCYTCIFTVTHYIFFCQTLNIFFENFLAGSLAYNLEIIYDHTLYTFKENCQLGKKKP